MIGRGRDDPLRHFVFGELAVAVDPAAFGGDDIGGVAGDQVERLALDGFEETALAAFDVVQPVQRRVELGVRECAWVDVGRDDLPRVLGGEQGMDPASGADIEEPVDSRARRQGIEDASRRRVGRDVVGRVVGVA